MDKFVVRSNPPIKAEGMIKTHCMSDAIVGAVVDVNSMCAVFAELRPTAPEEMCLLHEREISGVPVTALRVIAKTEEGFIGTLLDHFTRSLDDTQALIPHYNEKGFEELEFNTAGKKLEKKRYRDVPFDMVDSVENSPTLWYAHDVEQSLIEKITNAQSYINMTQWNHADILDDDLVTRVSAVSKTKRRVFRTNFANMCDDVFGRKAIDRNLANFAGIIMSSGLYLVE